MGGGAEPARGASAIRQPRGHHLGRYVIHADGKAAGAANVAGAKFLRELSRTLRVIRPATLLTCEDHSDWVLVTEHPDGAGLGFDATWYSNFANLLLTAGMGGDGDLAMDRFGGVLAASSRKTVVYHESHDEAGNSEHSRRTLMVAIAAGKDTPAPTGKLRRVAELEARDGVLNLKVPPRGFIVSA